MSRECFFISCVLLLVDLSHGGFKDGHMRLVGGQSSHEGRVEVYHDGKWGTVCDDDWDINEARVVCRYLNFAGAGSAVRDAAYGRGSGQIWLDNLRCRGDERDLSECDSPGWGVEDCSHSEDAGVVCNPGFQDRHMRLVGGPSPNEGRVEVYHDGKWGTVCDDQWDINEAHVVCRYLNFSGAVSAVRNAADLADAVYGRGSGQIWLDDLKCRGDERDLSECDSRGWGVNDCSHSEDAGVVCNPVPLHENPEEDPENVNSESTMHAVNRGTDVLELLGALFDSGRDCDLNISMQVDGDPAESICVHKLILTLDPEVSFLNGSLTDLRINVTSNCSHYVTSFVRYLYTRQINFTSSSLQCIHNMASDWGLGGLQEETEKRYSSVLPQDPTFQTQVSLYEYSVRTVNVEMQRACLRYLAWNFEELVKSPTWTSVPLETVEALLSRSDLVVPSESYVLRSVESWEAGRVSGNVTGDPFGLLKHVRFPMISAEDLYVLRNPRYEAGRLLGFQFSALRFGQLRSGLVDQGIAYTPRIYTGKPWSFTFDSQEAQDYRRRKFFFRNHTRHERLDGSFSTPMYGDVSWSTGLVFQSKECVSCLAAGLSKRSDCNLSRGVVFENKLVLRCAGRYVFHVQDFNNKDMAVIPDTRSSSYPCNSGSLVYQVVVRPKYTAGVNVTEEDSVTEVGPFPEEDPYPAFTEEPVEGQAETGLFEDEE